MSRPNSHWTSEHYLSTLLVVQRLGLDVQVIECRWGDGADEAKLQDILSKDTEKKIKAVAVVHNETTTGVTSDVAKVRFAVCACSAASTIGQSLLACPGHAGLAACIDLVCSALQVRETIDAADHPGRGVQHRATPVARIPARPEACMD